MRSRGWLIAHPAVWFSVGVLFAGQLPGEPLHDRGWLVVLLLLAVLAGRLWEGVRAGGSVDRQVRAALGYELPDFDPASGHLHTCADRLTCECAGWLYCIAQDAEATSPAARGAAS